MRANQIGHIYIVVGALFFATDNSTLLAQAIPNAQIIDNFDDNTLTGWAMEGPFCANSYTLTESGNELQVDYSIGQPECYDRFKKTFTTPVNFSTTPVLCFKMRSATPTFIKLQVELEDVSGNKTNTTPFITTPVIVPIDGNNPNGIYYEYCFDFSGDWSQSWPAYALVDQTQIKSVVFYVNGNSPAAGYYSGGTIWIDDVVRRGYNPKPSAATGTFYSNGNAVNFSSASNTHIYKLTDDNGLFQSSTVFNENAHNWTNNFDATFRVYFGCNDEAGADGISFFLMNDNTKLEKVGGGGGGCGYGKGQRSYIEYPKSVAIEFDTWDNTGDGITNDVAGATSSDHIVLSINGYENTISGAVVSVPNLEDNNQHILRVQYTAATTTLNVYLDGVLRLNRVFNIANYFNTGPGVKSTTAYWGFTGSTGGNKNEQWFSYNGTTTPPTYTTSCLSALPIELSSLEANDMENGFEITWSTTSEVNNDYFEIQRSTDNIHWEIAGNITGAGNSSAVLHYTFFDYNENSFGYYRLKQVDFDGTSSYSEVIYVKKSDFGNEVILSPNPATDFVNITVKDAGTAQISITDYTGNIYYTQVYSISDSNLRIPVNSLKEGFYVITITTKNYEYRTKLSVKD